MEQNLKKQVTVTNIFSIFVIIFMFRKAKMLVAIIKNHLGSNLKL